MMLLKLSNKIIGTFCCLFVLPLFFLLNVVGAQDRQVSLPVAQERIRNGVVIANGENAPIKCGETPFFREQQAILVGFAKNVSIEENMEACVAKCILEGSKCKSAMFFYEEGECIVNSDAALNQGESFVDEEVDKVVYFENGCVMNKQIRNQKGVVISMPEEEEESLDDDALIDALYFNENPESEVVNSRPPATTTTSTTTASTTTTSAARTTTTTATTPSTTRPKLEKTDAGFSEWGAWTFCDKPDGRRIRRRKCLSSRKLCKGQKMEIQWCSDLNSSERRTAPRTTIAPPIKKHVAKLRQLPLRNIMPDLTGRNFLAINAWGPWNQECVDFAVVQPCRSGNRLGFQNRKCNGFPFQCEGPFFRYCFLSC